MKIIETDLDTFSKTLYKNWCYHKTDEITERELLMDEAAHLALALDFLFRDEVCTGNMCSGTHIIIYKNSCVGQKDIVGLYTLTKEETTRLRKNNIIKLIKLLEKTTDMAIWESLVNKLYNTLKRRRNDKK